MYAAIINALPDCLNVKDLSGRFIAANPATAALLGARSALDLIGKSDSDFFSSETARKFRQDEEEALACGTSLTVDQRVEREDGSATYLSTLKAPLRDADGTTIGLITHNRDITHARLLEQDLNRTRQTLDDAINNMRDGLAIYDREGRLTFCNDQYRDHFPLTADLRVPGAKLTDIMQASLRRGERAGSEADNVEWMKLFGSDAFSRQEDIIAMSDGRWLQIKSVSVKDGTLILVSDITTRKNAEAELEASAREYKALFEHSVAGIFRSSIDGRMLRANPALARLNGYSSEQELLNAVNDIASEWYVDPNRRAEFVELIHLHGRVTDFVSEVYRYKTRERIWISETAWTVTDVDGKILSYEGTITEITDRKLAEDALRKANHTLYSLSRTDALTGLANRRAFDDCLAGEFDRAKAGAAPLSVMLIDVDFFKRYNDSYGHLKGDECLRHIAQVVAAVPRGYGDKACRYGGEEMSVVLPDTDAGTARKMAERLCKAVAGMSIPHSGSDYGHVTISIGVATVDRETDFDGVDQMIEHADKALYLAKQSGRNRAMTSKVA